MIDKALIIVFVFYALGFMMVGMEYSVSQVYHVELVSPLNGNPMPSSAIVGYLQNAQFNNSTGEIVTADLQQTAHFTTR